MLVVKNKKLESDVTKLKVELEETKNLHKGTSMNENSYKAKIEEQEQLIHKLEDDICNLQEQIKVMERTNVKFQLHHF